MCFVAPVVELVADGRSCRPRLASDPTSAWHRPPQAPAKLSARGSPNLLHPRQRGGHAEMVSLSEFHGFSSLLPRQFFPTELASHGASWRYTRRSPRPPAGPHALALGATTCPRRFRGASMIDEGGPR